MRTLAYFIILLISLNAHSASNCGVKNVNGVKDINLQDVNWSGECKDGYANGIGLLSFKFQYKNELLSQENFGKMDNGIFTGLHLWCSNTENQTYRFVKYYNKGYENIIGPVIVTAADNNHLPLHQRLWSDANAEPDKNNKQPIISYEKALSDIKAYITQRNEPNIPSVDFEVFKAYLEGRVKVTGEDDPPALGATLKPRGGDKKRK